MNIFSLWKCEIFVEIDKPVKAILEIIALIKSRWMACQVQHFTWAIWTLLIRRPNPFTYAFSVSLNSPQDNVANPFKIQLLSRIFERNANTIFLWLLLNWGTELLLLFHFLSLFPFHSSTLYLNQKTIHLKCLFGQIYLASHHGAKLSSKQFPVNNSVEEVKNDQQFAVKHLHKLSYSCSNITNNPHRNISHP